MAFDIHQLDEVDSYDDGGEEALGKYRDELIRRFFNSPEGEAFLKAYPEGGFWAMQLMHCGYVYLGLTLPQMTVADVEEIVTELFPRKVSLLSPDDAEDTLPELVAFWEYLKRAYKLPKADSILRFLRGVGPEFKRMMNDPSLFGPAKAFFMMGQSAGFDMTDEEDLQAFMYAYNASLMMAQGGDPQRPASGTSGPSGSWGAKPKRKKKRKAARAARKRQRKS